MIVKTISKELTNEEDRPVGLSAAIKSKAIGESTDSYVISIEDYEALVRIYGDIATTDISPTQPKQTNIDRSENLKRKPKGKCGKCSRARKQKIKLARERQRNGKNK